MESKKKIFIIDDDSFLLDMYALKFNQSNFEVATSLGAELALAKLHSGYVPDIMLLDIMMPVMDGFEMLEKMKEEKLAENTIKVVLSNRGQPSDVSRGKELGCVGYIVKASSTPSEVVAKVESFIKSVSQK